MRILLIPSSYSSHPDGVETVAQSLAKDLLFSVQEETGRGDDQQDAMFSSVSQQ